MARQETKKQPNAKTEQVSAKVNYTPIVKEKNSIVLLSTIIGVISILVVVAIAAHECKQCFNREQEIATIAKPGKKFWVFGKNVESGYLKHVFLVLQRLGYQQDANASDWDLLWAHDYPFRALYPKLINLLPHQRVNHFPGCGYITNKVDLATSNLRYIPPAFKLPQDKQALLDHVSKHPNLSYVQKDNNHRNIRVKLIPDINLDQEGTFIQEFIDKPLLINGHKFDIGIYTVITSIDPLRVYIYNGEALLRFCPVKYYPFDPENLDKYVVGDDYLPIWEVPSLSYYYNELKFGMRESLNAYLRVKGKQPEKIWTQIEDSIRTVILAKESKILEVVNKFKSTRNFFEMMRFDFVIDEDLNIYLLEANMSPNLSSAHFPPNQLLYEQVLYNIMGLLGIGGRVQKDSLAIRSQAEENMIVAEKNLAVFAEDCNSHLCKTGCSAPACQLCMTCLSGEALQDLREAYREHLDKGDCKRIFPPPMNASVTQEELDLDELSAENQLHYKWFLGKCKQDSTWC